MGIRYFAHPISRREAAELRADPERCLCCKPLTDLVNEYESHDQTLDLDKAWRDMQYMFGVEPPHLQRMFGGEAPALRPAAQLVYGDVTHTGYGWKSYRGVLDPEQVEAIATDLRQFIDDEWRNAEPTDPRAEGDYARFYIERAQEFTAAVAGDENGMIYWIG